MKLPDLDTATKQELRALLEWMILNSPNRDARRSVLWRLRMLREDACLNEMDALCKAMETASGEPFLIMQELWTLANEKLNRIQG